MYNCAPHSIPDVPSDFTENTRRKRVDRNGVQAVSSAFLVDLVTLVRVVPEDVLPCCREDVVENNVNTGAYTM